jgi:Tfp pilus assembly protein PilF/predicted aspartyl protease
MSPTRMAQAKPDAELVKAESLFAQGDLSNAKKALQNLLARQPNSVAALNMLTSLLLVEDDPENAAKQIGRAVKLMPNDPKVLANYGYCLFRQGDFKHAEIQFRKSLQLEPKQASAYVGLGRLQLTQLKSAEGLSALKQAMRLDPKQEDSFFFASEAYGVDKNLSMQIDSLQKYLDLKPKFYPERVQNAEALLVFFRELEKGEPAKVSDPTRTYELPVQPFFGLMIVEAYVNKEGPYRFLVDTGATSTVLSNALLDHLKIMPIATATVKCVGGSGKTATKLCKASSLKIGELEISNLPVASFDNQIFAGLIDGVLGTADLGDFLIALDYPDKSIVLTPQSSTTRDRSLQADGTQGSRSAFRILGNLILVPVSINHQPAKNFLFDTGAVTSTLSKRQAASFGVKDDTPNSAVDIQFAGACGVTESVLSVPRVNLAFGGLKLDYDQILAVELKEISKEVQTEVSGILGGDFFSKYKVVIDYQNTTVSFE